MPSARAAGGVGQVVATVDQGQTGSTSTTGRWPIICSVRPAIWRPKTDLEQAHALGVAAVDLAAGQNAVMATIDRLADKPYRWKIGNAAGEIANVERKMPPSSSRRMASYHRGLPDLSAAP